MELIETVRVERGKVVLVNYHYRRLKRGALTLGLPFPFKEEEEFKELFLKEAGKEEKPVLVRLLLKESGEVEINKRECKKREGVRLKSVYSVKRSYGLISEFKTSVGAEVSKLAFKEATSLGYDEALTYSSGGFISECAFANIFFFKDGVLFTPSLKTGCLRGTRREFVINLCKEMGVPVVEGFFGVKELLLADEVFITSAREDTCPVIGIDDLGTLTYNNNFYERIRRIIIWMY